MSAPIARVLFTCGIIQRKDRPQRARMRRRETKANIF
jgi:hypothetical protein